MEHDRKLRAVLKAAEAAGLTLNLDKCMFGVEQINYLGDLIDKSGIKPDATLVQCVKDVPRPTCKKDVQRLLGVVTYFGKFLPCLSEKTRHLRDLTKKESVFDWNGAHENEWVNLCGMLASAPVLAIFDPKKKSKVSTDASCFALGAALFQLHDKDWRPVAYASRVLSDSETRYAQIEKEALGITFGCERFREFIYGHSITVETDHRPLLAIAQKNVGDMPPRLQRFFLRLI